MVKDDREGTEKERRGKGKRKGGGLNTVRWFNPAPSESDKTWLGANDDKLEELALSLVDGVAEDGRLTIKYDSQTHRWLAILFVRSNDPEFEMDAMSVRGASAVDALILLAYAHFIKFEEAWVLDTGGDQGRWG